MKNLTVMFLLVGMTGWAQLKGNGSIETREISLENLTTVDMNLYAKVTIDAGAEEETLRITGDSNLISQINTEVVNGSLDLVQKEWIQPSNKIEISIGAPKLRVIRLGVHETVFVNNIESDEMSMSASVGTIVAEGTVVHTTVNLENGVLDATHLQAKNTYLTISGRGKATLNTVERLDSKLSESARLKLITEPKIMNEDSRNVQAKSAVKPPDYIRYIDFQIKNNSWNRNHFVVVGPKKNGSFFSYGFSMMPGTKRAERWTIGTKIFKTKKGGNRKLLATVDSEDEGATLKLFQDEK